MHSPNPHENSPLPAAAAPSRTQVWSDYWASGALHSCAGSFSGNYSGSIQAFWQRVFADIAESARVLEICCGNAPLSKLLVDGALFNARHVQLDAVDLAQVAPEWVARLPAEVRSRIRVRGGVDAAQLPLADASIELCMSQYGIEYVGAAAMQELRRVLRPGGRFAAVIHHHQSLPVRIAGEELDHWQWLRQPDGVLDRACRMLEPMARSSSPAGAAGLRTDAAANALRSAFNDGLQALQERIASSRYPDLLHEARQAVMIALQRARAEGWAAGNDSMAQLQAQLAASALRQQELVDCAVDAQAVATLVAPLGDPAPVVAPLAFDNGELAGWSLVVQRPG